MAEILTQEITGKGLFHYDNVIYVKKLIGAAFNCIFEFLDYFVMVFGFFLFSIFFSLSSKIIFAISG